MCEVGAFADIKVELVDGEIDRLNQPQNPHSRRQTSILVRLARLCPETLLRVEIGIDLGDDTVFGCDLALLREPVEERYWLQPDDLALVIEVSVSTLSRDLGLKLPRYAAAGVPELWIVDDHARVTHVYRDPVDGAYANSAMIPFTAALPVPGTDASITLA